MLFELKADLESREEILDPVGDGGLGRKIEDEVSPTFCGSDGFRRCTVRDREIADDAGIPGSSACFNSLLIPLMWSSM
jgi:hypothetical protein